MAAGADRRAALILGRTAIVLLLLLAFRARADSVHPDPSFDQALAAQVFTAAFTFMGPRTLEPVAVPQLTAWGLRGITALDPELIPAVTDAGIKLDRRGVSLATIALPASADPTAWGQVAAQTFAEAWPVSPALRNAGTQGAIGSFFDEVFNHLDPYSRYVAPDAAATERQRRRGAAGIGIVLAGRLGRITVAGVAADGPAARAGVTPGERLIAIDGRPVERADVASLLGQLNGEENTETAITLRGPRGTQTIELTRALIPAETVEASRHETALVLKVSGFTASTEARMRHEIASGLARRPQPAGIVIDLRGNRGGLLRQAVGAANLVMTAGPIATTKGRDADADHAWFADGADIADGLPIIVLVDGRSASAAEVFAAALEDDGRAVVVGSTTLGKGLVQTVGSMPDGGELLVTWSRILAPAGWPLQGLGVMPQLCTSLGEQSVRAQLAALSAGTQTMAATLATHRAARPTIPVAEILTIRDACPAAIGADTDIVAAQALIADPIAYATALGPS